MALMPRIMYGTAWKKEATRNLVISAVQSGFRGIDTACQPKHYNEPLVGQALKDLYEQGVVQRSDLFLQTKFTSLDGQDTSKPLPYDAKAALADQIRQSFHASLKNLGTDYLDSYVLHSPMRTLQDTLTAWKTFIELSQGHTAIRHIGISNCYDVSILEALNQVAPVQIVQNRWHQRNDWDREVVAYCRRENVRYQSFWTLTGSPILIEHPATKELTRKKGCTAAQVVYALAQSGGIVPLAGSTDLEHMKHGLDVEALSFSVPEEEKLISQLKAIVHLN